MGWLFAWVLMIVGIMNSNTDLIIAAGLFGIAGAIAFANEKKITVKTEEKDGEEKEEEPEDNA